MPQLAAVYNKIEFREFTLLSKLQNLCARYSQERLDVVKLRRLSGGTLDGLTRGSLLHSLRARGGEGSRAFGVEDDVRAVLDEFQEVAPPDPHAGLRTHTHTRTHTRTHTHTYTHTHTHTHARSGAAAPIHTYSHTHNHAHEPRQSNCAAKERARDRAERDRADRVHTRGPLHILFLPRQIVRGHRRRRRVHGAVRGVQVRCRNG